MHRIDDLALFSSHSRSKNKQNPTFSLADCFFRKKTIEKISTNINLVCKYYAQNSLASKNKKTNKCRERREYFHRRFKQTEAF